MTVTIDLSNMLTVAGIIVGVFCYSMVMIQIGRKYQHKNPEKVETWMKT